MAVVPIDGMVRVSHLPACANIQAPTTTELNAGTALEGFIRPDGLDISWQNGKVDAGNLGSTQNAQQVGRRTPTIQLGVHHDSGVDTAYNLMVYRATGFLAVRRGVLKGTAWTSGDKLEVYPIQYGEPSPVKPQPDGSWDFDVDVMVTSDAATRAVVA